MPAKTNKRHHRHLGKVGANGSISVFFRLVPSPENACPPHFFLDGAADSSHSRDVFKDTIEGPRIALNLLVNLVNVQ